MNKPPKRRSTSQGTSEVATPGEFLLYVTEDGRTRVECRFMDESLWLTQAQMAELFQVVVPTINEHLKTLFTEGEIQPEATIRKFRIVRQEGGRQVSRQIDHYNLDAILAVGYRVRSVRGTQFRRWATERLREYLVKGFTLDDDRLKNPPVGDSAVPDRFGELLERIRDIRASERRMYLRVREIFAMAADYLPTLPETTRFFRIIQNKLHYAVTGRTAAELIRERADSSQPNMGLTSWASGQVRKADVSIAKNYLREPEIAELNRIVTMWLDFAEDQAMRRKEVFLQNWLEKLDVFLSTSDSRVLGDAGQVSFKEAAAHAERQYEEFASQRRADLEVQGEADIPRLLEAPADQDSGVAELGRVEKQISSRRKTGKGGKDVS